MAIEWLLMDLGGVCLEVHQGAIYERLAREMGMQQDEILHLPQVHRPIWLEIGAREVSAEDAHALFAPSLPREVAESILIECVNAELGPQIEHTELILRQLKGRVHIGCLSNTNSIHAAKLIADYTIMNLFERKFFSQELKLSKPDFAIYEKTAELLRIDPQAILFFDDKEENVAAARQCGWRACTYTGPQSLIRGLNDHGINIK